EPQIGHEQVDAVLLEPREPVLRGARQLDAEPATAEHGREPRAHARLVVDDQDRSSLHHGLSFSGPSSVTVNRTPLPGALSSASRPPMASTRPRATGSRPSRPNARAIASRLAAVA